MRGQILSVVILLLLGISGCRNTGALNANNTEFVLDKSKPSIVLLGRRHIGQNKTEQDYVSCIGEEITDRTQSVNVIPENQFINIMFPFFEKRTSPLNLQQFSQIVKKKAVKQKFEEVNLEYLVWIEGKTRKVDQFGGVSCAIGPGGGGCLGYTSWDEEANYQANIWNVKSLSLADNISTERSGTSYMPAIIVPIPLLANVKETACSDMARQIEQSLTF